MSKYAAQIEEFWKNRDLLLQDKEMNKSARKLLRIVLSDLDKGAIRVAEKDFATMNWKVNEWVKQAILLAFKLYNSELSSSGYGQWFDKIPPKFDNDWEEEHFLNAKIRCVPGSYVRKGAYIGENTVLMPCFINIGAYIGANTMIDTWSTVGSCAQIGSNCHISGGVGIGGVLEPLNANPVIIEDNCFIGARSEIAEGVIVEEGSVIAMGTFISASTKIIDRATGEVFYGKVPKNSVVVPGTSASNEHGVSLYAAIIIKKVDAKTLSKVGLNELLRY